MSVLDWIIICAIFLFFIGVAFYALGDLFRDRKFYKDKLKNVQKIEDYKTKDSQKYISKIKEPQKSDRNPPMKQKNHNKPLINRSADNRSADNRPSVKQKSDVHSRKARK